MKLKAIHALDTEEMSLVRDLYLEAKKKSTPKKDSPIGRAYKSTGLSQEKIAKKLGVHPSTVSRYKSDKKGIQRRPRFDTLKKLASMGIRFRELY